MNVSELRQPSEIKQALTKVGHDTIIIAKGAMP
jgi:hypothetical protein